MKKTLVYLTGVLLLLSICVVLPVSAYYLTSPNGGENWRAGTTHDITWKLGDLVDYNSKQINLYERQFFTLRGIPMYRDVFRKTITPSVPGYEGSFSWPIPSDLTPGSNYIIELKDLTGTMYDKSNAVFTIAGVKVTSPNGGESWARGSSHRITWNQAGLTGTNVKVELLFYPLITISGTPPKVSTLAASVPAAQGYIDWTPAVLAAGSIVTKGTYRVKVTSIPYPSLSDMSDGTFTLANPIPSTPTIKVTSPTCGESWLPGTTHTVAWSYTGDPGPNVQVVLLKAGTAVGTATSSTSTGTGGTGSFPWTISSTRAPGTDYQILVQSTTQSSVHGTSCFFTIGQPSTTSSITVTSPKGGEVWQRGTLHPVTWTYTGNPGPNVKVELLQAGTPVGTATSSTSIGTSGTGSFPWTISSTRSPGTTYRIKVTSLSQTSVSGTSNGDFTITA